MPKASYGDNFRRKEQRRQSISLPILPHLIRNLAESHDQYLMKASPLIFGFFTKPQKRLS
jgi:hypothetical protein